MVTDDHSSRRRLFSHYAFIPAGVFIGLGIGILLNFPEAGILIGLGLGLFATLFMRHRISDASSVTVPLNNGRKRRIWSTFVLVIVLILFGLIIWGPILIWSVFVSIILILVGIGFVERGFVT
jgi:hypothetical protein